MRFLLPFCLAAIVATSASAHGQTILGDVFARKSTSLNGKWHYIVDIYDTGYYDYRLIPRDLSAHPSGGIFQDQKPKDKSELIEYDFDKSPTLNVPGDWNSQDPKLIYYEGTIWYRTRFDAKPAPGNRLFVYFGAANYESDVYLNGTKLGKHLGGYTPFAYEITKLAKEKDNSLVVRVNNQRHPEGVPTVNTDWWNYGGITRDVLLVETPATFISNFVVRLKPGTTDRVEARVQLDGPDKEQTVTVSLPNNHISAQAKSDATGLARMEIPHDAQIPLWSPESPRLNDVVITAGQDRLTDEIGFRKIAVSGKKILLNGKQVFLRGISIHEENPLRGGRAWSEADARLLLGWAKDLGCNFVRLAHYPHNEHMARVADEMGIMVWEEIPVYWTIHWSDPETLKLARQQLAEMILRDQNRASVVVWSVANETPVSEARTQFLKTLIDDARSLDNSRLVSAAMEVHFEQSTPEHKIVNDPLGQYTDLLSFNEYVGWYDGLPDKIDTLTWTLAYDKPVFISEFGADAKRGMHGDALTRFSEEYQADVYRRTLPMLEKIPGFSGCSPWILFDFRSPRRLLPGVQDGYNRKGLLDETGKKKAAYDVLQKFYAEKAKATEAK